MQNFSSLSVEILYKDRLYKIENRSKTMNLLLYERPTHGRRKINSFHLIPPSSWVVWDDIHLDIDNILFGWQKPND